MPSVPPAGEPSPRDGTLPAPVLARVGAAPLSAYVHVPFCATRCGYCDFNTYTSDELGSAPGSSRAAYLAALAGEIGLAAGVLGPRRPALSTVFFGGGTPSLLAADELVGVLAELRRGFGLEAGAEVTLEANPESVSRESLARLREGGFTRVSFGMQSAVPAVLAVLERQHTPGRVPEVVGWAREAGFESVSLDAIYGTPGETLDQWRHTVEAAVACAPDHVSAYALIVEQGTRLATRIRRGELAMPDDDLQADMYLLADEALTAAGLAWYELSNWAAPGHACRHNLAYWRGHDWWGAGPGAHSHVAGVRWWNVRHPRRYSERLDQGESPAEAREVLDEETRHVERILLESRLAEGLDLGVLSPAERHRADTLALQDDPLVRLAGGRLTLTLRGRLLADAVVRELVG